MTRRLGLPTLLVSLAVVLGCARPSSSIEPKPSPGSDPAPGERGQLPPIGVAVLIDPGQAPHEVLRFTPELGARSTWSATSAIESAMTLHGTTMATSPVAFRMTFETEVLAVTETEKITSTRMLDLTYLIPPPDPALGDALRAAYADVSIVVESDLQGTPRQTEYLRGGQPIDPASLPGLGDSAMPSLSLPREPIGVGGRWEEYDELERNGLRVLQTTRNELVSREGSVIEIRTVISQQPLSRTLHNPDLPADTSVELREFRAEGEGSSVLDLSQPVPIHAQAVVSLALAAEILVEGEPPTPMTLDMHFDNRFASVRGAAPGGVLTGVPGGVPTGVPGGVPGGVAGDVPEGVAGGIPGGVPKGVPGGVVSGVPGGVPGGVATSRAKQINKPLEAVMANAVYTPDPNPADIQAALPPGHTAPLSIKVDFCIQINGSVSEIQSSGANAAPEVGAVLEKTVAKWRFKPFVVAGKAIKTCTRQTFKLTFG